MLNMSGLISISVYPITMTVLRQVTFIPMATWYLIIIHLEHSDWPLHQVRMAERSKALRSGRSRVLPAWVRIPLLTNPFYCGVKCTLHCFGQYYLGSTLLHTLQLVIWHFRLEYFHSACSMHEIKRALPSHWGFVTCWKVLAPLQQIDMPIFKGTWSPHCSIMEDVNRFLKLIYFTKFYRYGVL